MITQLFFASKRFLLAFLLLINLQLAAQDLSQTLPFDTSVTTGTLANGLRYYIKPNAKPENKIELRLVVNAGSILENDDQQGLAHFMEHMNFNGTEHYPKNALVDYLQSIGVEFGADLNAYTSFDETVYILPIPTDKPGNAEKGFEVLGDWAQRALITDKDVDEERKVVLEESRLGKGAEDRMMKIYLPKLMAGSRYASRLPIGQEEILKTFKPEVIRQFYKDWYRPNLMSVMVVGDITIAEAKAWIYKYFYDLKNPENERPRTYSEVPAFLNKEALVVRDKEATNEDFSLVFSSKKASPDVTLGDYRNTIVQNLFTGMINNRLQELTQVANPPFLYSYAYVGGWARGYESFQLYAAAAGDFNGAVKASIGELVKAQKYGFSQTELDQERKNTMAWIEKAYNERSTTESGTIVSEFVRNFLESEPMSGIENDYQYYNALLPTITVQEINDMANKWIGDNKTWFALAEGPESGNLKKLSNKKLLKMVNKAYKQKVQPRAEKSLATSLLAAEPVPGKIVSESQDADMGVTHFELSNGVKVTVKTTDFKSDEILFSGMKKGGTGQYGAADNMNAQYMNQIISTMGWGAFSPTDLEKFLSGKYASINAYITPVTTGVSGNSTVKDLETMLQLNYLKLTSPRMDKDLFAGFMAKYQSQLEYLKSNPEYTFLDTMNRFLQNNSPLANIIIPTAADLNRLNAERVLEMYNAEFGNADGFHFFIVGNVDVNTLKPLMEKYLASLPAKGAKAEFKDNGLRPITGNNVFEFKKGAEPKSLIFERYFGEIPFSQDLAIRADLLGNILNIKGIEELREKIGGIYSGNISAALAKEPYSRYSVNVYLPCGPESVDTLLKAVAIEMERIKAEGPTEKDLAKVKIAKIEAYKEGLRKNETWTSYLGSVYSNNLDKAWVLDYEKLINSITAEEIKATANQLLNAPNHFRAVLYPEK